MSLTFWLAGKAQLGVEIEFAQSVSVCPEWLGRPAYHGGMTETETVSQSVCVQPLAIDGDSYVRLQASLIKLYKWAIARADGAARLGVQALAQDRVEEARAYAHKFVGFRQLADEALLSMKQLTDRRSAS